ncbi:MAG: flagellar FlbD family protein [Micrococcus sp.]|nr:flagellar FlbD family protein [Micrococcus sp.]
MILLTTLRGDRFGLNPDLIEEIRANGTSCVVTMITGRSHTAAEDIDTVQSILNAHRAGLLVQAAQGAGEHPHPRAAHLTPVPDTHTPATPDPDKEP